MESSKKAPNDNWWRGGVIYQIYPRSYADSNGDGIGDLPGITGKLEYVARLGVDAIWLSPFFKSPMKDFGYDISDYCDVDPMFGTLDDIRASLREWHTWVVRRSGRLVGAVRARLEGEVWEIGRLMVAPDLQGSGLGRVLLEHVLAAAPDEGHLAGLEPPAVLGAHDLEHSVPIGDPNIASGAERLDH